MSKKTEKDKNNNDKESKSGRKPIIHTTISKRANKILEKYANLKGDDNKIIFGSKSKVIEEALELIDKYNNPEREDLQMIWNRAKDELNMVLVGKRTFLSYISGDYKRAFKENIAIDIIEWYKRKNIDEISLNELLESIKNIWLAANYFYKIDVEVGSKGTYQMSFYHDFHNEKYSNFWGNYFSELLSHLKECSVEIFGRNESLILRITPSKK
ncbi:MAG: hypothetical protein ACTSQS_15005 [Promethearchaeota archaeon]